jgi:hypothetical protein
MSLKRCKCKRGFVLSNKGCCQDCYNEAMQQYDKQIFSASQSNREIEPFRQPVYENPKAKAANNSQETSNA